MEQRNNYGAHLVGSTRDVYQDTISETSNREPAKLGNEREGDDLGEKLGANKTPCLTENNYFKSAQWSPDGTTILSSSADNTLRSFIVPPNLLGPDSNSPHTLIPYGHHSSPEPVYATSFYPGYNLQEPTSCLALASPRGLPMRLFSPFSPGILASYSLVSPTTELYITPHSLLFNSENPNHFFAGSDSCLSVFDINRNGEGPMSTMHTTPSRRNHSAAGGGMKGIVSTMAMNSEGLLAAGTFSRWVGLYDGCGRGDTISVFSVAAGMKGEECPGANGLTQVLWSACGRYLLTVERGSDGIGVLDIRGHKTWLAWLRGRNARTQQRLGVDLMGGEVWAGGVDGVVRAWNAFGTKEGVVGPTWEKGQTNPKWQFQAHGDAVSSTALHPTGSVLATCSGSRQYKVRLPESECSDSEADDSQSSPQNSSVSSGSETALVHAFDNSLKLWALWVQ